MNGPANCQGEQLSTKNLHSRFWWVNAPNAEPAWQCYVVGMSPINLLLLVVILLLLFGGGGFYWGGPVIGGSGLGLVLLICLIVYLMGGFQGPEKKL